MVGGGCAGVAGRPAFRFHPPRAVVDWEAVHALDLAATERSTDIDALEGVLDVVAYGDLEGEDARGVPPASFMKLFRLAQMAVEYLLFVQDRLAADNCAAQCEMGELRQRLASAQAALAEARGQEEGARREARRLRRTIRTLEVMAPVRAAAPPPAAATDVAVRVVEVGGSEAKLERLEARAGALQEEREALRREMGRLREALAAALSATAHQSARASAEEGVAAAVEAARREERAAAVAQLAAALEEERARAQRDSIPAKPAAPATAGPSFEALALRARLAESLARQRELEEEKAALGRRGQGRHAPSGRAGGVGSYLEDGSEEGDARSTQLQAQVDELRVEVEGQAAARAAARSETRRLEGELDALRRQVSASGRRGPERGTGAGRSPASAEAAARQAAELERLEQEVAALRSDRAAMGSEVATLKRLVEEGQGGAPAQERPRSPAPARRPREGEGREQPAKPPGASPRPASPGEEYEGVDEPEPELRGPSAAERAQWRGEMRFRLAGHERPGAVGRFPHSLERVAQTRKELGEELAGELERELASYGIDPGATALPDPHYRRSLAELKRRRAAAGEGMDAEDRRRMEYMRATVSWHVNKVAARMRPSSPEGPAQAAAPLPHVAEPRVAEPPALRPIRTRSDGGEVTPGDAFYSPLRAGAPTLSPTHSGSLSPSSPPGPRADDGSGTPRSPWAITHDRRVAAAPTTIPTTTPGRAASEELPAPCRLFHAPDVGGSAAPLRSAAAALPAERRPGVSPPRLPDPQPLQGAPRPGSPAAASYSPAAGRRPSGSLSTASTPRPQTSGGGGRGAGGGELSGWGRHQSLGPTRLQAAAGPVADSLSAFEQRHA